MLHDQADHDKQEDLLNLSLAGCMDPKMTFCVFMLRCFFLGQQVSSSSLSAKACLFSDVD